MILDLSSQATLEAEASKSCSIYTTYLEYQSLGLESWLYHLLAMGPLYSFLIYKLGLMNLLHRDYMSYFMKSNQNSVSYYYELTFISWYGNSNWQVTGNYTKL